MRRRQNAVLQGCRLQAAGCRQQAARLQAARLQAKGCALQGCRQQVAHCKAAGKAAGSRWCIAGVQAAGCKAAGRKAAMQKCRTWLLAAAKIANCTSGTAAFAKGRKRCIVAVWHPEIVTLPTRFLHGCLCEEAKTLCCCNLAPRNRYTFHAPALAINNAGDFQTNQRSKRDQVL